MGSLARPKIPGQARPNHASGPGLGLIFWPDGQDGPDLDLDFVQFSEVARPEARGPTGFLCDGPGLGLFFGPTVGLGWAEIFCIGPCPARSEA
jgi:hypothetical protein